MNRDYYNRSPSQEYNTGHHYGGVGSAAPEMGDMYESAFGQPNSYDHQAFSGDQLGANAPLGHHGYSNSYEDDERFGFSPNQEGLPSQLNEVDGAYGQDHHFGDNGTFGDEPFGAGLPPTSHGDPFGTVNLNDFDFDQFNDSNANEDLAGGFDKDPDMPLYNGQLGDPDHFGAEQGDYVADEDPFGASQSLRDNPFGQSYNDPVSFDHLDSTMPYDLSGRRSAPLDILGSASRRSQLDDPLTGRHSANFERLGGAGYTPLGDLGGQSFSRGFDDDNLNARGMGGEFAGGLGSGLDDNGHLDQAYDQGLGDNLLQRLGSGQHNVRFNEQPSYSSPVPQHAYSDADQLSANFGRMGLSTEVSGGSGFDQYMGRQLDPGYMAAGQLSVPDHTPSLYDDVDPFGIQPRRFPSMGGGYGYNDYRADDMLRQHGTPSDAGLSHDTFINESYLDSDPIYNYERADHTQNSLYDMIFYQNQLESNAALDEAARQQRWNERVAFEELDDAARAVRWRSMSPATRGRLGLDVGYHAARLDSPGAFERRIQTGWDKEGYLSAAMPLNSPVLNRYSTYFEPSFSTDSKRHSYIDPYYLAASDLSAYSNALKYDQALDQAERERRWHERLAWEALDEAPRAEKYRQMKEEERMRLGLGINGLYGQRYNFNYTTYFPNRLEPLQYSLPTSLSTVYRPYIKHTILDGSLFKGKEWEIAAVYYDLLRFENELRRARNLTELQRQKLWKERLAFQQLSEASRRARWLRMKEEQKRLLGLSRDRFFGARYHALGSGYGYGGRWFNPNLDMKLRYRIPPRLQTRYGSALHRNLNMVSRNARVQHLTQQQILQNRLVAQRLSLASKEARLRNLSLAQLRAREQASKQILARMDRERQLANGHLMGAKVWRSPSAIRAMGR